MEKLGEWLERRGFALQQERGAVDHVDLLSRVVTLDAGLPYQTKLSVLMHECGHVRIFLSRIRRPKARISGATLREDLSSTGRCDRRGRASRISLLHEEMEAWDCGEKLAHELKVKYTRRTLERCRTRALMTYVTYAASKMRDHAAHRKPPRRGKRN